MYSINLNSTPDKSCEQVARNTCYELIVDRAKNRVYFTILGFWKNKDAVPDLLKDWEKSVSVMQPNFTVLTDMRSMITHPQELNELHMAAQKMVLEAGVQQVANVLPTDKIANLQANSIISNTMLPYRNFNTYEEAETWLNQLSVINFN